MNQFSISKKSMAKLERRINWVNRELDARIPVQQTLESIRRARADGYSLSIDRTLSAIGDLRSANMGQAAEWLRWQWGDLAAQNNYTNFVLLGMQNGGRISDNRTRLYMPTGDPNVWEILNPYTGAVEGVTSQPLGSPLTPTLTNRVLADHAKHLHEKQESSPDNISYRET